MSIYIPGQNAANTTAPNNQAASTERKQAEFWLNVSYYAPAAETWVSLPFNIPLDGMNDSSLRGQLGTAQNLWRDDFIEQAKELEPGERKVLIGDENLALELYRQGPKRDLTENNPFLHPKRQ